MIIEKIGYKPLTTNNTKNTYTFKSNNINYQEQVSKIPYNNAYAISFLGKTEYSQNEMDFRNLRKQLATKIHKADANYWTASWNNMAQSTEENAQKEEKAFSQYMTAASGKNDFEALKQIEQKGITNSKLKESLDDLLDMYAVNVSHKDELEHLQSEANKVLAPVSNYRGVINGKSYTNGEIDSMLLSETNPAERNKLYQARKVEIGNRTAPKLIELVEIRNKFAQKLGHNDYFSYMLDKGFKTSEEALFNLISKMDEQTSEIYNTISDKNNIKLANIYGITPDELQPWHYGLELPGSPTIEGNKYVKSVNDVIRLTDDTYKSMGWDFSKMPLKRDLLPREGKDQHAYCFDIDSGKDARIFMNARPDIESIRTSFHEHGHGIYDLGISTHLPYFNRQTASPMTTEAVAMMAQALPTKENILTKQLNVPIDLAKRLEMKRIEDSLGFMRFCMHLITFEKQLYTNPKQDLQKLWYESEHKYLNRNIPKVLDNRWASERMHLVGFPAYYQNYFRAELLASQLYDVATQKLGPLTQNSNTAKLFNSKLFSLGNTLKEAGTIKHFTGSELSIAAYCKQLQNLTKYI